MARPSKLTPEQWAEVFRKDELGIPQKDLAKEYGVSCATISKSVAQFRNRVEPAVTAVLKGEQRMAALTPGERLAAESIIDVRRVVLQGLGEAAAYGAKSAAHLQRIAHKRISRVLGSGPNGELTEEEVRAASEGKSLLQVADLAAAIPLRLVEADLKREDPPKGNFADKTDDELIDALNAAEDELQVLEGEAG